MNILSRNTDYTIRALVFMAKDAQRIITVSELAGKLKIPKAFLRKTLQILNQEGILKSLKGKGGGFQLDKAPQRIYITDLMNIFQGSVVLNECFLRKKPCPNQKICKLKGRLDRIEKEVVSELKKITIQDLL